MLATAVEAKLDDFTSQVLCAALLQSGALPLQCCCALPFLYTAPPGYTCSCRRCHPPAAAHPPFLSRPPRKQNMSNAVLAFAKLEYRPRDSCLEGLARAALQRIKTFSPQALSNTLWGLSKLDIQVPPARCGLVPLQSAACAPLLPSRAPAARSPALLALPAFNGRSFSPAARCDTRRNL